ncbi:MAG TPA: FtsX-like permease family protein [Gammaproteobacteria bacterium]|nr:FtsX-like permease family protein [Gammaproteobacteria bacterium]
MRHFRAMLRTLLRDKLYTAINVAGLSLAIASCVVIGMYLRSELTYDRHNALHERIYRVEAEFKSDGRSQRVATTPGVLAPMLVEEFADVQAFVRFTPPGSFLTATDRVIRHGDDAFVWSDIYAADPNVFDVFTHEILYGDPKTALADPSSVAVSRTFARRYFGDANPLGETITLDGGVALKIALVFADLPPNTHLKYDVLLSHRRVVVPEEEVDRARALFGADNFTYLVLPERYDLRRFETVATAFYERHMAARAREIHSEGWSAWLRPLDDIHLYSDVEYDRPVGNRYFLLGLEAAVAFLLLIACINHVNLATASAARRVREVGTRKILGATRRALALRFVGESSILSAAALVVALLVVELVVPRTPIADWLGTAASLRPASEPLVLAATGTFALLLGVLSGLYPAIYLAGIPALTAMTRGDRLGGSGLRLRELLVLVQFTVTTCVIACTLLMGAQMRYVASRPLGFEDRGKLAVTLRGTDVIDQISAIERELTASGRVLAATSSDSLPGDDTIGTSYMDVESNDGAMKGVLINHLRMQQNFVAALGMHIIEGRDFSADIATDQRDAFIVNETLVRQMGWRNPLGKRMGLRGRTVIGVVRDFHLHSLHTPIQPVVMYLEQTNFTGMTPELRAFQNRLLVLEVPAGDLSGTLQYVADTIRKFDPEHPFEYRFLDEMLGRQYSAEQHLMRLIGVFSSICVFVACLGLFGLATFTTARRTKEIGIRKVLGATTSQIVALLSQRTVVLVAIGSVLASAIAYAAMARWLQGFAYRVDVGTGPFAAAAAISLVVALGTVALQSLGAARVRPVLSLRQD